MVADEDSQMTGQAKSAKNSGENYASANKEKSSIFSKFLARLSERNVSDAQVDEIVAEAKNLDVSSQADRDEIEKIEARGREKKGNKEIAYHSEGDERSNIANGMQDRINNVYLALKFKSFTNNSYDYNKIADFVAENPDYTRSVMKLFNNEARSKDNLPEEFYGAVAGIVKTDPDLASWGLNHAKYALDKSLARTGTVPDEAFSIIHSVVESNPSFASKAMDVLANDKYSYAQSAKVPTCFYYDRAIRSCVNADASLATQDLYNRMEKRKELYDAFMEGTGRKNTGSEMSLDVIAKANPSIEGAEEPNTAKFLFPKSSQRA